MIIYHGSDHIIEKPEYLGGREHNDYGRGLYCTEHAEMAREWSSSPSGNGYLNSYEIDTDGLTMLDLNEYPILVWLTVLLEHRTFQLDTPLSREAYSYLTGEFHTDHDDYDLITGYRADDSYFTFARDFVNGTISLRQLKEAMYLGKLGNQTVIKSSRAFDRLKFLASEEVDGRIWYPKRKERDDKARREYYSVDKGYVRGDIYITRILDEEMKRDDPRLQ